MNIPDTTTEAGQTEISGILLRLAGIPLGSPPINLYDPANMALAARVLHFVRDRHGDFKLSPRAESVLAWFFAYSDDGVRTALDGVLSLAIEAGMIEVK